METTDKVLASSLFVILGIGAGLYLYGIPSGPVETPAPAPASSAAVADGEEGVRDTSDTGGGDTGDTGAEPFREMFVDALSPSCPKVDAPRLALGEERTVDEGKWVPLKPTVVLESDVVFANYRTLGLGPEVTGTLQIQVADSGLQVEKAVASRAFGADPEMPCAYAGRVLWQLDEGVLGRVLNQPAAYSMTLTDGRGRTATASANVVFTTSDAAGADAADRPPAEQAEVPVSHPSDKD